MYITHGGGLIVRQWFLFLILPFCISCQRQDSNFNSDSQTVETQAALEEIAIDFCDQERRDVEPKVYVNGELQLERDIIAIVRKLFDSYRVGIVYISVGKNASDLSEELVHNVIDQAKKKGIKVMLGYVRSSGIRFVEQ